MTEPDAETDPPRWPALFSRAREPVFVLNQRRRIVFANAAWEGLAKITRAEARSLTCTTRDTGHSLADLGATLAPPDEVFSGQSSLVRRPLPGQEAGPPWWDIDFVPLMGAGELIGVIGRIHVSATSAEPDNKPMPSAWANLRQQAQQRSSMSLWESSIPAVRRMVGQARLVASAACPAALVGETGTGKRTLVRAIHALSSRKELPFVGLACDRLPADVVRAAVEHQPEKIGIVYLQAPAALPRDLQVELAKRIVDKTHVLLGCPTEPASDLREGRLTEELWGAAATVVISVAPLRLRFADLPRLADSLLRRAAESTGRPVVGLTPAALENLRTHSWPGNLNELDDVLRTAATRCDQPMIDVGDLPLTLREPPSRATPREAFPPLDKLLEQVEARMIRLALERAGGNKTKAAESLGIWRPRLIRRMEALGIADPGD